MENDSIARHRGILAACYVLVGLLFGAPFSSWAQIGDPRAWVELLTNPGLEGAYTSIDKSDANGVVTGLFPTSAWVWWDGSLFAGTHTVTTYAEEKQGTVAGSALKVTTALQSGFTTGACFSIGQSKITCVAGQTYRAKIWLKAATNTTVSVALNLATSPWPKRASANCAVTSVWQQFTFDYTATATESLLLQIGSFNQAPNTIWVDEPSFARLGSGYEWFVSPTGDDSNPGTIAQPFRTFATALSFVLAGDTLHLRGGTYRETLQPSYSGAATARITIAAYAGETVTISGCDVVAGPWTSTANGIYTAAVDWDLGQGYNQVFVDGEMQHEARYPNHGPGDLLHPATVDVTVSDKHTVTSPAFGALGDLSGARFLGGIGAAWAWQTAVVAGKNGNTLTLDPATESSWWWPNFDNKSSTTGKAIVYGKLSLLDADGEWFLQTNLAAPHTLHLRIASSTNPGSRLIELKRRNWCIDLNNVSYITVRGLRLRAGAVRLNGTGNALENCEARYLSHFLTFRFGANSDGGRAEGSGVLLTGDNNVVRGSTIFDTAGSGLLARGRNHLITRNHIYNTDYTGTYAASIALTGEAHIVTFNTAHDSGRDIIYISAAGLAVMHNDLFGSGKLAKDLGVIYSGWSNTQTADGNRTRVAYNWLHDGPPSELLSEGVYLDNFARNFQVDHNVMWNFGTGFWNRGINLNSPADGHELHHNTLFDCQTYNQSTYSSFPEYNADPNYWNAFNQHLTYRAFNNLVLANATTNLENPALRDFRPKATSAAVDPATASSTIRWSTNDGFTGVPASFQLYNTKNFPFTYEEQAGQGVVLPGINDGYLGRTPDSGAYEFGGPYWKPGVDGWAVESAALQSGTATGVGDTIAKLQGTLVSAGTTPATVQVFWGTADAGTSAAAWKNQTLVGTYTGSFIGLAPVLANLTPGTAHFVRFRATNAAGEFWSDVTTFKTTGQPPPAIIAQPANLTAISGEGVTLAVSATSALPLTYQWQKNGVTIAGATGATLTLNRVQPSDAGSYAVVIANSSGAVTSAAGTLTVAFSRLINLSILTALSGPGDTFTLGYVVGGAGTGGPKPLVIRAAGPSLGALGVGGTLDDPKLEWFAGAVKTGENDNWCGTTSLASAMGAVGAFAYGGPISKDAAAAVSVASGDNSVKISAAGDGTGAVLAEIYDASPVASFAGTTPRLINFSVLKQLGAGFTVGFVVGGNGAKNVLVRAIGPTLGSVFGVAGAVPDPQLTLFSGQTVVATNDNWSGGATLAAAFASVGAFALPVASKDAVVLATLQPGSYTVQVSGVGGATGTALVEIYETP